ncbi:hypothetical protein QJS66_04400 [Kocuria rhizophila]|nr:hypothetical protein QJS66_04400 [Kocuria rhizophila]
MRLGLPVHGDRSRREPARATRGAPHGGRRVVSATFAAEAEAPRRGPPRPARRPSWSTVKSREPQREAPALALDMLLERRSVEELEDAPAAPGVLQGAALAS